MGVRVLERAFECQLKQNLQVAVTIAKEYTEQLGVQKIMSLFQKRLERGVVLLLGRVITNLGEQRGSL